MTTDYQRPPVRVALMGLGRAMFTEHYPVFKAHPSLFRVVAACDLIKERRDIVARDFPECRMFRQFADMLDERDIDIVDIATCTNMHVKHALMSLKRGCWTLLEGGRRRSRRTGSSCFSAAFSRQTSCWRGR